ncbi:MAG: DinB family protein [Planctomycetes bacterium]|nr:DinB family protein [Planctomycetota bacterium]
METGHLSLAITQIDSARAYTRTLLEGLRDDDWFRRPQEGVTHLAWQMGHLAMAEYMLTMVRMRGKRPEDEDLISKRFLRLFTKGTRPEADPPAYPPVEEIRRVFDAVHAQAMVELPAAAPEELQVKVPEPHVAFDTKLGSLFFCAHHEMLHAGQIGLLRRLLGREPVR